MGTATATEFLTGLQNKDTMTAVSLLHDNVVWLQPGQTPVSGAHRGKIAVTTLLASFAKLGIGIELLEAYKCDDETLCRIVIHHENGRREEFQLIGLEDGLISSIRHYGDTDYLMQIFDAAKAQQN